MKKILCTLIIVFITHSLIAQDYKFGKVSKEELEEKVCPLDSSANAAYLLKKRKTTFKYVQSEGFNIETEIHERVKIYNSAGFDWATVKINLYQSGNKGESISRLKATTFTLEDGKIVETDLSKNEVFNEETNKYWDIEKFTMPNLTGGCVVEWTYKISSPFNSIDDIQFQHEIPVKKTIVSIETPEYFIYNKRSKGYILFTPKTIKSSDKILLNTKERGDYGGFTKTEFSQQKIEYDVFRDVYDLDNIPALVEEPYVDNIKNYLSGMEYELTAVKWPNEPIQSFSNTWEQVSKTIYKDSDFSNQIKRTNHFEKDVDIILASCKTNSEKMMAIFEFIKQKIKWNNIYGYTSYNGTSKAYKEGVGNTADINLNLVSMLNYAGLKANPVLISTKSNGIPIFPTISGFNSVVAAVEINDDVFLLDATNEYSTPNIMPLRNLNWKGRLLSNDGNSKEIDLIPSKHSVTSSNIMVSINEDIEIEGFFRKTYANLSALNYRTNYGNIKNEDLVVKIEKENKGVEIEDYKISNKKDSYKNVVESCKFFSENMLDVVGNKIYIKPLLFNSLSVNPFKLDTRDYPIDYGVPTTDKNMIRIEIPEGYKIASFPEELGIGLPNNFGVYVFKVSVSGKSLQIKSQLKINTAIIPAQDYLELKAFYDKIITKNSELIVLEKVMP